MTGLELINIIKANDLEDKQIDAAENDTIIFTISETFGEDDSLTRWTDKEVDVFDGTIKTEEYGTF